MERTIKLQEAYAGLRTDLLEEVETIEARIIKPASDAKESIQPLKKVIKKREDRKVGRESNYKCKLLALIVAVGFRKIPSEG